jgi:ribosomal protein S13
MKKNLYLKFGLNLTRSSALLNNFGFGNLKSKNIKNNIIFEKMFDFFLLKKLENKDFILKKNYDLVLKKIENGSYKGYKFSRGLPIYNQRTRTNGKNAKKQNSNFLNVYL